MAFGHVFAVFALLVCSLVAANAWCITGATALPACSQGAGVLQTFGCYGWSSCAVTNGQSVTASVHSAAISPDTFSAFLLDATNFAAYKAGNAFSCIPGIGSCDATTSQPVAASTDVSISATWTVSGTYTLVVECDNTLAGCQFNIAYNLAQTAATTQPAATTQAPTSTPAPTTVNPSTGTITTGSASAVVVNLAFLILFALALVM